MINMPYACVRSAPWPCSGGMLFLPSCPSHRKSLADRCPGFGNQRGCHYHFSRCHRVPLHSHFNALYRERKIKPPLPSRGFFFPFSWFREIGFKTWFHGLVLGAVHPCPNPIRYPSPCSIHKLRQLTAGSQTAGSPGLIVKLANCYAEFIKYFSLHSKKYFL